MNNASRESSSECRAKAALVSLALIATLSATSVASATPLPANGSVDFTLVGGVASDLRPTSRSDFVLHFQRRGGAWDDSVWGMARRYNQGLHEGRVAATNDAAGQPALRLEIAVRDDPWVEGGFAEYLVRLPIPPATNGWFSGWFNGVTTTGAVRIAVLPLPPSVPGVAVAPPVMSEHPRLLFRRTDLPALRQRADTEFGRQILAALRERLPAPDPQSDKKGGMDEALGRGFLYALFGDTDQGNAAIPAMMDKVWNPHGGHAHDTARSLLAIALVYDLVYDLLNPRDRDLATRALSRAAGIVTTRDGMCGNWNNGPNSNWTAIGCGGAGMASLAALRERGPFALQPEAPVVVAASLPGEPVLPDAPPLAQLTSAAMVTNWLVAGPYDAPHTNALAALGAGGRLDASPGTILERNGQRRAFRSLPAHAVQRPAVDFVADPESCLVLPDAARTNTTYLFTRLLAPAAYDGMLRTAHPAGPCETRVWIGGREFPEGAALRFEPGLHTVLIEATGSTLRPRFETARAGWLLAKRRRYERSLEDWERARARYDQTFERQDVPIHLSTVSRVTRQWLANALGDHGWKTETETYQIISLDMLLPYAAAQRTVTGEGLGDGTGLAWVLPLGLLRACASGGGGYGNAGAMGLPTPFLCCALDLAPPDLQPALLWELDRRFADPAERRSFSCRSLVFAFLRRPLDVTPRPPAEVMPLALADQRKGLYLFRNRFADRDDIVTHFFLRSEPPRGPAYRLTEAGSFRISGLGTAWAVMGSGQDKHNPDYAEENTLSVAPSPGIGYGRALYSDIRPDGSGGVVGADMSDVYNRVGWKDPLFIRDGTVVERAERHFGVDYSPASGAAAWFVVLDRVRGGGRKRWRLHTGGRELQVNGVTFTIQGRVRDTVLAGRFVSPPDVRLTVEGNTLTAASDATAADFLAVLALSKGPPAAIGVEGEGLAARVRLGQRTVRYDGERLRWE